MPGPLNWPAILAGAAAAYALGMVWFGPIMFGRAWSAGSHGIRPPAGPPVAAMTVQLAATLLLALAIGMTETYQALGAAITLIAAAATLVAGMDLFSQKTAVAAVIDAGYVLISGAVMIAAQAIL